ncbi:MAG: translation elongation factor Ts [Candidatus Dormibacteraeota bacterium]|uniref:Elongation factor Ts n=1 Tax=Candidatus Dormiibacter inghamiae TaxID=3127013 RepID=A0A934KBN1_9BACT|nr:translation elongation factor Ts [Candidatus Dormibacteraeota bacterium]MBJ7607514.1 translation elongation factor Ts [Candidatus Dormibacteraeota bacterium]
MIDISLEHVKQLRDMTGAGMMDCKKALEDAQGNLDRAVVILRERGIAKAAKRADRVTSNGVVEAYLHRTSEDYPPQIGALIELNCESDFVAKGTDFRTLARELAMHVAAAAPRWVSRDEVPTELVEQERTLYQLRAEQDGKPAQAIPKIVAGQLEAFYKDSCLLDQPYMRDPATPVRELVASAVAKLQENITVRRIQRFSIKEG